MNHLSRKDIDRSGRISLRCHRIVGRADCCSGRTAKEEQPQTPSSEGLRQTVWLREPTDKKPGGQTEHEGRTLECVAEPDAVIIHAAPEVYLHCQTLLTDVAAVIADTPRPPRFRRESITDSVWRSPEQSGGVCEYLPSLAA